METKKRHVVVLPLSSFVCFELWVWNGEGKGKRWREESESLGGVGERGGMNIRSPTLPVVYCCNTTDSQPMFDRMHVSCFLVHDSQALALLIAFVCLLLWFQLPTLTFAWFVFLQYVT